MQYYYKLFFFQLEIYTVYTDIAKPHNLATTFAGMY